MFKHFWDSIQHRRYRRMRVMWLAMRDIATSRKAEIAALTAQVSSLDRRLAHKIDENTEANSRIAALKSELSNVKAADDIKAKQIELLTSVVLRDHERVLAETAVYAQFKEGTRDFINPTPALARQLANANGI